MSLLTSQSTCPPTQRTTRLSSRSQRPAPTASTSPSLVTVHENQPSTRCWTKGSASPARPLCRRGYEVSHVNNPDIFAPEENNALGTSFHLPFKISRATDSTPPSGFDIGDGSQHGGDHHTHTGSHIGHPAGVPFDVNLPFAVPPTQVGLPVQGQLTMRRAPSSSNLPVAVTVHDDFASGAMFGGGRLDLMGDQIVLDQVLARNTSPFTGTWGDLSASDCRHTEQHLRHGGRRHGGNPSAGQSAQPHVEHALGVHRGFSPRGHMAIDGLRL